MPKFIPGLKLSELFHKEVVKPVLEAPRTLFVWSSVNKIFFWVWSFTEPLIRAHTSTILIYLELVPLVFQQEGIQGGNTVWGSGWVVALPSVSHQEP